MISLEHKKGHSHHVLRTICPDLRVRCEKLSLMREIERVPLPGFTQTWKSRVTTFFRINSSLCLFSFQGQNNFISLMDIHVQHLASLCRICGDKIKDHKRKVVINRFVSEIHQIRKDLLLLDSPNVHPQLKKSKKEDKFQL